MRIFHQALTGIRQNLGSDELAARIFGNGCCESICIQILLRATASVSRKGAYADDDRQQSWSGKPRRNCILMRAMESAPAFVSACIRPAEGVCSDARQRSRWRKRVLIRQCRHIPLPAVSTRQ